MTQNTNNNSQAGNSKFAPTKPGVYSDQSKYHK